MKVCASFMGFTDGPSLDSPEVLLHRTPTHLRLSSSLFLRRPRKTRYGIRCIARSEAWAGGANRAAIKTVHGDVSCFCRVHSDANQTTI